MAAKAKKSKTPSNRGKKTKKPKRWATRRGRPKKYNTAYVVQARAGARNNLTDKQLAEIFGVDASTIAKWKTMHPDFAGAIEEGRAEFATGEVELSLRQQALPHPEVTVTRELRGRGKNRKLTVVGDRTKKKVVNTHAAIAVLKADKPDKYGDSVKLPDVSDALKELLKEIGSGGSGLPISER